VIFTRQNRSCDHKKRYRSRKEAKAALQRLVRSPLCTGQLNVYRGNFCAGWHFGHTPRRKRKRVQW
jgi:hypothetical protein